MRAPAARPAAASMPRRAATTRHLQARAHLAPPAAAAAACPSVAAAAAAAAGERARPRPRPRRRPRRRLLSEAARAAAAAAASPSLAPPLAAAQHGASAHPPAPPGADDFAAFEAFIVASQDRILREAERLDGSGRAFLRDRWERPNGAGHGVTAVLEGGDLLEKAAANVTVVRGTLSPQRAQAMSGRGRAAVDPRGGQRYAAAALSLVFHPRHPHVPTLRADVRLFQVFGAQDGAEEEKGGETAAAGAAPPLSWYGGGCDLTPALLHESDARDFHASWKGVCDAHLPSGDLHAELKAWCDRYFYVTARREHRGVGGLFFDDLERTRGGASAGGGGGASSEEGEEGEEEEDAAGGAGFLGDGGGSDAGPPSPSSSPPSPSSALPIAAGLEPHGAPASAAAARRGDFDPAAFARDVLANVLPSWTGIAARRRAQAFTEAERTWQLRRRGRYLEFNLLDDRGVRFGLADGKGRVESIMVSAPPLVAWGGYGEAPPAGSREEATLELLRGAPREWV